MDSRRLACLLLVDSMTPKKTFPARSGTRRDDANIAWPRPTDELAGLPKPRARPTAMHAQVLSQQEPGYTVFRVRPQARAAKPRRKLISWILTKPKKQNPVKREFKDESCRKLLMCKSHATLSLTRLNENRRK